MNFRLIWISSGACTRHLSFTAANLTTRYCHFGIAAYATILTATIDGGHDDTTTDGHIGFIDVGTEVRIGISIWILHLTTTGTEYEAYIHRIMLSTCAYIHTVMSCILHTAVCQCCFHRAYLTTADNDRTLTGVCFIGFRLAK